jgi:hypothetical protein
MANITPVLFEVRPQPTGIRTDASAWTLMIERDTDRDLYFVWKDDKVLNTDGEWVDGDKSVTLTDEFLHEFKDAITLSIYAVEKWKVNGQTYKEFCAEEMSKHVP